VKLKGTALTGAELTLLDIVIEDAILVSLAIGLAPVVGWVAAPWVKNPG